MSAHLLTVLGWLQQHHLRVPGDVSVVCRDSEPFLESVIPIPTRYLLNSTQYARRICRLVTDLAAGGHARPNQQRIMPSYVRGETLGPVR
jgi:DNA-binding LacI/PurR family transcriptional regulator